MSTVEPTYLGDGVYAKYANGSIVLWTDRLEGRHWMALGPYELKALNEYNEKIKRERNP